MVTNKVIDFDFKDSKKELSDKRFFFGVGKSQILIQLLFDISAFLISYYLIFFIRFESSIYPIIIKPGVSEIFFGTMLFLGYWLVLFYFSGMYKNWYERSPFNELWRLIRTVLIGCAIIVFAVKIDSGSSPRQLYLLNVVIITGFVLVGRTSARIIEKRLRKNRILVIPSIIVGTYQRANTFFNKCQKSPSWGYNPLGLVLIDDKDTENIPYERGTDDVKILGNLDNLNSIVSTYNPEEIIISSDKTDHNIFIEIASYASKINVKVKLEPDLYDIFTGQAKTQMLYGIPLIEVRTQLMKPWQLVMKRIFDVVFSSLVIIIGAPFWLLVASCVKLSSKGPVFYTQPRVGKNGKVFKIFKFRSMTFEPEKKEQKWTVLNDPRVTKFGKFIRKTHIDEIPQFYNVIIGDMSVVGPRPEQPKFVKEFSEQLPYYHRRHNVRPGITGWWQVTSYGQELSLEEVKSRTKDDFYYIENMSLKLDIEIVLRTVYMMLIGHGQA